MKKRALFIDRDGVINYMILQKDAGFDSPQNLDQVELVEGIVDVISLMNEMDIPVIEVSNQPGVAKGKMTWELLNAIEDKVHSMLNEQGARITKSYRCFHHPNSKIEELKIVCDCRKPKSGLLLQAEEENNLDLENCAILGDTSTDMEAGKNVGCKTILFLHKNDTPEKIKVSENYKADFRVNSLSEVNSILKKLFI